MPDLTLWSTTIPRQIDFSSCTTDAIVTVKDALKFSSFIDIAASKCISNNDDVNYFNIPEELMKTAQIGSFPKKSNADEQKVIHFHNIKDSAGKKTGESTAVVLSEFRKKYDKSVEYNSETKLFGTYTLAKGKKIAEILKDRWEKKHNESNILHHADIPSINQESILINSEMDLLKQISINAGMKTGSWDQSDAQYYTYSLMVSKNLYQSLINEIIKILDPNQHNNSKAIQAAGNFIKAKLHEADQHLSDKNNPHIAISIDPSKLKHLFEMYIENKLNHSSGATVKPKFGS